MALDLLFVNGPVFGGRPNSRVGVDDGRIVLVDGDRSVNRTIDLRGRMLVSGFQDSHVHPLKGGLRMSRCDMSDDPDRATGLSRLARPPVGEWVRGGGWAFDWFERGCPSKELLDELVPDRPAFLVVRDGHSAWANSRALTVAGITAATPDPPDGRIERLADGSPQGTLHEGAMRLIERHLPPDTAAELDLALDNGQQRLLGHGITAWQDAWITPEYHAAYLRAVESGRLLASVRGALWWDRHRGFEQIDELVVAREHGAGRYRPASVKLMLDGVVENFTASVLHPYHREGGGVGIDFISAGDLAEIVARLDALGFQCHFHSLGDRAVRAALDAVEIARERNGPSDVRHHLAHLQLVDPADIPRFRELGVVANCQPLWACNEPAMTELTVPFLGERARHQYPFGALARAGARLAMGSDWPVSSANVLWQISVAVNRTQVGHPETGVFLPEERLSVDQALTAFTEGSAFVNHLEDRGRIDEGMVADLVVLSEDPHHSSDLATITVDMTVVEGQVVYER
jgi:predicted amidohydrolase YtcJ